MKKNVYVEPDDYFPEEVRKKYGLGEYDKDQEDDKSKNENKEFRDYVNKK